MPPYKQMYQMLDDVVTDTIAALERMQRLARAEAILTPESHKPKTSIDGKQQTESL